MALWTGCGAHGFTRDASGPVIAAIGVSGFTIVRDAVRLGYPVAASLRSLAPLVDETVVAVGASDDGTLELVQSLDLPGLRIVETEWDESLRVGGKVLAQQTNLALAACRHPWAFYLQADEVVHEADYPRLRAALGRWGTDDTVDALEFRFLHFEGTPAYVNRLRYRKQCRLVRTDGRLQSVRDAAGFGRSDRRRLRSRRTGATIYHYGCARPPEILRRKARVFASLYTEDAYVVARARNLPPERLRDTRIAFRFRGTHPAVMAEWIAGVTWELSPEERPPLDTPWLDWRLYAAWLRKQRILPRRWRERSD